MKGARTIDIPRILRIERGAMADLAHHLADAFDLRHVVVATGADTSKAIAARLATSLTDLGSRVTTHPGLVGTLAEASRLLQELDTDPATLVLGVGGGQPIDVAKLASRAPRSTWSRCRRR